MKIDSYNFGRIVINGKSYFQDVIVFPDKVYSPWTRKKGHFLLKGDLKEILKKNPEILIIGTGYSGLMKVSEEISNLVKDKKIEIFILKTKDACQKFNKIANKDKTIIAAMHLTC